MLKYMKVGSNLFMYCNYETLKLSLTFGMLKGRVKMQRFQSKHVVQ